MKRLLAMLLTLAMVLSMLPAAFTADGDAANEKSGITVKYDFTKYEGMPTEKSARVTVNTPIKYTETNGFWEYNRVNAQNLEARVLSSGATLVQATPVADITNSEGSETPDKFFAAFHVKVPVSGWYDITLHNYQFGQKGASADLYIIPGSVENSDLADYMRENESFWANLDFCADTGGNAYTAVDVPVGGKYFEKGEYVFAYAATGKCGSTKGTTTYAASYLMPVKGITLDGGTGKAVMAVSASIDKSIIDVGQTAQLSVKGIMSDFTEKDIDTADLSVTATPEDIVSVENGTITALKRGDVTLEISVSDGEETYSVEKSLTVDANGARVFYSVGTDSRAMADNGFLTALDETYTNGFYSFFGTSSDKDDGSARNGTHLKTRAGGVQIGGGIALSFEVYIPVKGTYTMEMWNNVFQSGGKTEVWLTTRDKLDYKTDKLGTKVGEYICYKSGTGSNSFPITEEASIIEGFNIEEAGWYVLSFRGAEYTTEIDGVEKTTGSYGYVGDFYLTSGAGTLVPMKKSIKGLDIGIAEAEIIMSDGKALDLSNATVKYYSSNPSVVAIGEDDGLIDIYAIGDTVITAEVTTGGETIVVEKPYTVAELPPVIPCAEAKESYDFTVRSTEWIATQMIKDTYSDVKRDDDVRGITYKYTDGKWEWFGSGPDNRKSKEAVSYTSRLQLLAGLGLWDGLTINVEKPGKYLASLEYYSYTTAGDADIYIVPKPTGTDKAAVVRAVDPLLHRKNYVGYVNFINPAQNGWATKHTDLGVVDFPEKGEYVLVFKQGKNSGYFRPVVLTLDGYNNLKLLDFTAEKTDITFNESVNTSLTARLLDGTVLDNEDYSVAYESSDTDLATVDENGVVTGKGHGAVTITATATSKRDGSSAKKSIAFNAIDNTEIVDTEIVTDDFFYVGEKAQISLVLSMKSGNRITLPREDVTFTANKDGILSFEEAGYVSALSQAENVTVTGAGQFRGEAVLAEAAFEVILHEGKTEATYYTAEKRATAQKNTGTYDWAKSMKKSAESTADSYVANLEDWYYAIPAEGLPRSRQMGVPNDPFYDRCRYCNGKIDNDWVIDPIARPWKVQCPDCKRLFPSNEFDKFYELGLDKQKNFDRIRAFENHRAMLLEKGEVLGEAVPSDERKAAINGGGQLTLEEKAYYGYGKGYLKNVLYTELDKNAPDSINNGSAMRAGEDVSTWGVDDGWGYIPADEDGNAYQFELAGTGGNVTYLMEKHCYVAIYMYFVWRKFTNAIEALSEAYLYSGDIKYGRAGAILLDRIADVWHTYDLYIHNNPNRIWMNTDGTGTGIGIVQGRINDNDLARPLVLGADAFYPAIFDTQVIDFLSQKAKEFGYDELEGSYSFDENEPLLNAKVSSSDIWRNWENGIIRKNYWGVKFGRIVGNFGMRQAVTVISAIVQDREPETSAMIEWVFAPTIPDGTFNQGGGDVTGQLIDVIDRDGMGHEASLHYNKLQIEGLGRVADYLTMYKGKKDFGLYDNPKFRQMFVAYTRPVTPMGHPQIADAGVVLFHNQWFGDFEIWKNGFKVLKDTEIGKDLAQYIWRRNGRTAEGLHYDIFTENPESFEDDVMKYVDETGRMESDLMAGYGFAILRDGGIYNSASSATETDNQRDFWISAGVTDGHGHLDALNLGIEAFGLNFGADLGYPENTGSDPNRGQWMNETLAHNTVTVNEKSSKDDLIRGFPLHFDDSGIVKLMDIDASHKYDETENYRRSLVMVKINDDTSYGVDFFRVTGGKKHTYSFHSSSSKVNEVSGLSMATEPELMQVDKNGTMDWATYLGKDAVYVKNADGSIEKAQPGATADFETIFPVTFGQDPWTQPTSGYETMFPRGYTWLRNVRRAAAPTENFTVDFEITDYHNSLADGKGLHLRMTQIDDTAPDSVAFAGGYVPMKGGSAERIGYADKFNSSRAKMLEYILIERDAEEGQELDSLFTTVYEPYRNTSNIEKIEAVEVAKVSGEEQSGDMVRAVKVTHVGGERIDYVVYATNNTVKYNVGGVFDFQGFVGVYTTNKSGSPIYRYVNDGSIIGEETGKKAYASGKVEGFERGLEHNNYIDVSTDATPEEVSGKHIYVNNDGAQNAVYKIESAAVLEEHTYGEGKNILRLDLGGITLIRGHQNPSQQELGYTYNIQNGQSFTIPLSYSEDFSPEFNDVSDNITTSAGSTISVSLSAQSPIEENAPSITYIGTTLPRGASINAETGVFTWKPDSSQIGDNHVAITARDADGRESTIHFTVTVYGSTTGGSSSNNNTETPSENAGTSGDASTPEGGGGGGGGGGGAAPSDTPNTDDESGDETGDNGESGETGGNTDNTGTENGNLRFTDLANYAWAEDAINTLAEDGIIKGTTASTFAPASNITRADFALLLVRAFDLTSDNAENFADVSASDYFAPELAIARNTGIVNGIGDNKFAPRNIITRQDMMVIVYRALQKLNVEFGIYDEPQYPDYDTVAPYARDAVSALIGAGLVNGKNGVIAPTDYTTRAEVAVLIKRILDYLK